MDKRRKILWIILLVSALFLIIIQLAIFGVRFLNYKDTIKTLTVNQVDLDKIPSGTYTGFYDMWLVKVKVEVKVKNGRITDIKLLEHKNGRGKSAEVIIDSIIAKQSLQVDTISGATASSKAILKATETALTPGVIRDNTAD